MARRPGDRPRAVVLSAPASLKAEIMATSTPNPAAVPPGPVAPPGAPAPPRGSATVGGQAGLILAGRLISASSTAVLLIVVARMLGDSACGLLSLAASIGLMASFVADLGISFAIARYMAEEYPDEGRIRVILRAGMRLKAIFAAVTALAILALSLPLATLFDKPGLAAVLQATALVVLFRDLSDAANAPFHSLRMAGRTAYVAIAKAVFETAGVLVLLALGLGAVGAALGSAIGFGAATLLAFAMLGRRLSRAAPPATGAADLPGARTILRYGSQIWLVGLAWSAFTVSNQILLGLMSDSEAVAAFDAPWRLLLVLQFAGTALAQAVGPRLSAGSREDASRLFMSAFRVSMSVYLALGLVTLAVSGTVMPALLGEDGFEEAGAVLAALTPYVVVLGVGPLVSISLNYLGDVRARKWIALAALAVNIALGALLIPWIGVIGPAIATNAAIVVYVGGHYVLCRRNLILSGRTLLASASRAAVAAALGAGVCYLLLQMLPLPDLAAVAVAAAAGLAVIAALLVAVGEIGRNTLNDLRGAA